MLLSGILALLLAAVHLFGGKLRVLDVVPRSRWLSGASGVSVAYVFVHVLPDLAEHQEVMREAAGRVLRFLEHHVYLIALLKMMAFYRLERFAKVSRLRSIGGGGEDATEAGTFWIHVVSFALYNLLIGYLLVHEQQPSLRGLLLFFAATSSSTTSGCGRTTSGATTGTAAGCWPRR